MLVICVSRGVRYNTGREAYERNIGFAKQGEAVSNIARILESESKMEHSQIESQKLESIGT